MWLTTSCPGDYAFPICDAVERNPKVSYQNQRLGKIMHHTLGDGIFGNFINISAQAACCHALINPDNCTIEMERVVAEARRNNQPAYIIVPSDYALSPVTPNEVKPVTLKSNEASLKKAVAGIVERLKSAKSVVALPAFTLSRLGLRNEARQTIESLGRSSRTLIWCLILVASASTTSPL